MNTLCAVQRVCGQSAKFLTVEADFKKSNSSVLKGSNFYLQI